MSRSCEEKYTVNSFKVSRALRNKLCGWHVLEQFEEYFGEFADFLHGDLPKPEIVLQSMNSFANLLESRFSGQPTSLLGPVFFEISKFCALPSEPRNICCKGGCWMLLKPIASFMSLGRCS